MGTTIAKFKGYILNGEFFRTKDDVRSRVRGILYSYPVAARITGDDSDLLLALLQGHPEAARKIGCGIAGFEVRPNPRFPNERGFYLIRMDGSEDDFSYQKCLSTPKPMAVFKAICRKLIGWQMHWLKSAYFREYSREDGRVRCPLTGQWTTESQAHVDHIPPDTFAKIVTDFIHENNIKVENIDLQEATDIGKTFSSASLIESWVNYHKLNAKLRVISAFANLNIVCRKEQVLNRLSEQMDMAEIYELAPVQFEFLIELALTCVDPKWYEQDRECLENFASHIAGPEANHPFLRTKRHEIAIDVAIDWVLSDNISHSHRLQVEQEIREIVQTSLWGPEGAQA